MRYCMSARLELKCRRSSSLVASSIASLKSACARYSSSALNRSNARCTSVSYEHVVDSDIVLIINNVQITINLLIFLNFGDKLKIVACEKKENTGREFENIFASKIISVDNNFNLSPDMDCAIVASQVYGTQFIRVTAQL